MEGVLLSKANGDVRIFLKRTKEKKYIAWAERSKKKMEDVMVEAEAEAARWRDDEMK